MYIQYVQYAMPISREEKDAFTFYMPGRYLEGFERKCK